MSAPGLALVALACGAVSHAVRAASARRAVLARVAVLRALPPVDRPRAGRVVAPLAGAALGGVVGGPVAALLGAAAGAGLPLAVSARRRAQAVAREGDALPDVVDVLARALRAGAPPGEALLAAAEAAPPGLAGGLRGVASAAGRGVPLVEAVERWAEASPLDGAGLVVAALAVAGGAGGDPSRSVAAVADTLRERRALRREVRALSSQARLSAAVIGVAPAAFAVLGAGTDRATARFLLGTPAGAACLLLGLGLDVAGWRWMVRITGSIR